MLSMILEEKGGQRTTICEQTMVLQPKGTTIESQLRPMLPALRRKGVEWGGLGEMPTADGLLIREDEMPKWESAESAGDAIGDKV